MTEDRGKRARSRNGKARLEEVARLAGVSTATVSRAFNLPDKVSPSVRERVRAAAAELGWIPDAAGRALASSRTHLAGAIIPTLDNEIFARQVSGTQSILAEAGFTLILGVTNYDPDEGLRQVNAMLARGVEALTLVGEDHPPALFEALEARGVPYVVTYSWEAGSPHTCVGFDNGAAFAMLADHLLALGHRRFAAVFQPLLNNGRVQARLRALTERIGEGDGILREADIHVGPSTIDFGAESLAAIAARPAAFRPTAIVCGNDNLAIGVLAAAQERGLQVPGDFSVTGFDDLAISSRLKPSLTTMSVDNFAIGSTAARSLLQRISGGDAPSSVRLVPALRKRQSTASAT